MVDLGRSKKVSTPLPAVVGRERLKRALLALVVEDGLGGTLVRGEKGTAKSTAVRALVDLLPEQRVVTDCPYGCPPEDVGGVVEQCEDCCEREDVPVGTRSTPLVTLPLGATRDRVVGSLSVDGALDGEATFDPGLLARANRGVLYVDEVNLLEDHLVDVLLDAAAAGTNRVERDGVSVSHPASFSLIGTMNPEEGDLRPQLRDRFDLCVEVTASSDVDERVAILNRVVDGGSDRDLRAEFADATASLRRRVQDARERRPEIPAEFRRSVAELCRDANVDGHRADFAVARAARAFAALDGRPKVIESDVAEAAEFALAHRMRSGPFEDAPDPEDVIDGHLDRDGSSADDGQRDDADGGADGSGDGGDSVTPGDGPDSADGGDGADGSNDVDGDPATGADGSHYRDSISGECAGADGGDDGNEAGGETQSPNSRGGEAPQGPPGNEHGETETGDEHGDATDEASPLVPGAPRAGVGEAAAPEVEPPTGRERTAGAGTGRGEAAPSPDGRGARVRSTSTDGSGSVDPAATVREAARAGRAKPTGNDLQQPVRTGDAQALTVFVSDASASMAPAMRAAKGVALELLKDAYAERDEVALIAFGGTDAETVLPPTTRVSLAARHLKELPTADRTPLPAGLDAATELVEREDPDSALVVLVSDGRANATDGSPTAATRASARRLGATDASVLVVDAGDSRAGLLDVVLAATDASRVPLSALSVDTVVDEC